MAHHEHSLLALIAHNRNVRQQMKYLLIFGRNRANFASVKTRQSLCSLLAHYKMAPKSPFEPAHTVCDESSGELGLINATNRQILVL